MTKLFLRLQEPFLFFFYPAFKSRKKGQVIVEYILLLVISTVIALALINLVAVSPGQSSPVFGYWKKLLEVIGSNIST